MDIGCFLPQKPPPGRLIVPIDHCTVELGVIHAHADLLGGKVLSTGIEAVEDLVNGGVIIRLILLDHNGTHRTHDLKRILILPERLILQAIELIDLACDRRGKRQTEICKIPVIGQNALIDFCIAGKVRAERGASFLCREALLDKKIDGQQALLSVDYIKLFFPFS